MKKTVILLTVLLIRNVSFGQINFEEEIIQKIDVGYSTRWDMEQLFGKGELLDDYFLNPDIEHNRGKEGWVHSNGIQYKDKGMAFISAYDGEIINKIYLTAPFMLNLNQHTSLQLGATHLGDVFPGIDSLKISTTGGSNYWSFRIDNYTFYVAKSMEHRNKKYFIDLPDFKNSIDYYKNQPISIVTIDLPAHALLDQDATKITDNLYGSRPIYAPKEITHINCFDMAWPDHIQTLLLPLYILTGGQKSQERKQGYWKAYGSNHQLMYEGTFKKNIKIGVFKYYDNEGNLVRTKKYSKFNFYWTSLVRK